MINAEGGINGRKIKFISYDDAYSPAKAVEQARKLVESDEVLLVFNPLGTSSNTRDPEILQRRESAAAAGRQRRDQVERSEEFSVDHGLAAELPERGAHLREISDEGEARRQGRRALPERRFRQGLSERPAGQASANRASMIVAEESYETSEPNIDAHVDKLKAAGADIVHQHHHAEIRGAGDHEE